MEGGEGSNAMTSALRPRTINSEPSMVSFVYKLDHTTKVLTSLFTS